MGSDLTPMMRQYLAVKREVPPGTVVMFRLGDFYEMFGDDAILASPILGATLTRRNDQPMCGVPYHAVNSYLAKLIRAGKTVALCDQVEDPKTAKGLVRREVTRIVTPGTVTEDGLLDETANTYVACVFRLALALLDVSTGEFVLEEFPSQEKLDEALLRIRPAERLAMTDENAWTFSFETAFDALTRHFRVLSLDGFGLEGKRDLVSAAGALLHYVGVTLHHNLSPVRSLTVRQASDALVLDWSAIVHLQLLPGPSVAREASLLGVLDVTKTPMGSRTMRRFIAQPLADEKRINRRLDVVEAFVRARDVLSACRSLLSGVRDVERLIAKVDAARANPRDVKALAASLKPIPEILAQLARVPSVAGKIRPFAPQEALVNLIDRALVDEPPVLLTDGGFIADGYNAELDEVRSLSEQGHQGLAAFQAREQARTGIPKLKVKHVPAFGFLIEIPKSFAAQVPEDYVRRQTLTTGERYVTAELKDYEAKVLGATEKAVALEQKLFRELVAAVSEKTPEIQAAAQALGELDALLALADRALAAGYVRPTVDDSDVLDVEDGRHPVIEQLPDAEPFVPNGVHLNTTTDQILLITGPNMAGKSTFLRQVATLAVMAQMGSFVPASSMRLGVLDRIFTRIGAGDDLARGRSTFLVEMQETANILNNATPRSLLILDEIGRGTSTFDGISIAWAVAEYLHGQPRVKAKTLFATHYHELTDLATVFPGIKNYTVKVKEEGSRVVFLRRIAPGIAEKSFGLHVGAMAGLPAEVVERAKTILENLESNEVDVVKPRTVKRPRRPLSELPGQMSFF